MIAKETTQELKKKFLIINIGWKLCDHYIFFEYSERERASNKFDHVIDLREYHSYG